MSDTGNGATPDNFTVGEKLRAIMERISERAQRDEADPNVAKTMRAVRLAHRLGLTKPVIAMLPPLDDEEQWHELIGFTIGFCLNITSDGQELDVDACRELTAGVIASLWEE